MRLLLAHLKVYIASLTNNINGKRTDVHGRRYTDVYKKFGHREAVKDYLSVNSWGIK